MLHVIPASYQVEEALKLPGTKVFMKAGKKMKTVKEAILSSGSQLSLIHIYRSGKNAGTGNASFLY